MKQPDALRDTNELIVSDVQDLECGESAQARREAINVAGAAALSTMLVIAGGMRSILLRQIV